MGSYPNDEKSTLHMSINGCENQTQYLSKMPKQNVGTEPSESTTMSPPAPPPLSVSPYEHTFPRRHLVRASIGQGRGRSWAARWRRPETLDVGAE
jgi:hypothetical protein